MANKRKRDESSDSDSDITPGRQTLPVANLPHDFDEEPQDGMQYLFLVRRDARRLPHVTRARNPYHVSEMKTTLPFAPPCTSDLPREEWRIAFQAHFCNLRKNMIQETIHVDHGHPHPRREEIPEKKDRDAWWKFLTGHPESSWQSRDRSVQKKPGAIQEEQLSPPMVTPCHLLAIDHRMSVHLLMYFTHWINVHLQTPNDPLTTISVSHGQWIFALLTKVEDQLSADEMNLLRNLARACLGHIQRHRGNAVLEGDSIPVQNTTRMTGASCWMIFAAIAGHWGQRDLWADAAAALGSV